MKRCPYCAEEIQDAAVKCKHCGSVLNDRVGPSDTLDRHETLFRTGSTPQYDTLDESITQEKGPTILGGQYRVVKKLGKGGMGVVYLAEDLEMGDRPVAIKVLPPELSDSVRAVENLRREAITAIKLTHPNIIRLYGFHSDGDMKFLVMEYVDGQTLEQKLAQTKDGRLGLDETVAIVEQVAAALDYAHSRTPPVFHRDLKPSNVMLSKDGEVRLLDFGIAREMKDSFTRVTGKQDTSGTLPYMSPEQVRGKRPTAAMDIYSLGVVCYECLGGQPPFYTGELTYQILHEAPGPLEDVDGCINQALQQALAKDASGRPSRAGELVALLQGREPSTAHLSVPRKPDLSTFHPPETTTQPRRIVLPSDLIEVPDARYAPLEGLAPGSRTAQDCQRKAVLELGLPLEVRTGRMGIVFRLIPAGTFIMGSPPDETHREHDETQHEVTLSKPFYCGKYPVTQGQWEAVTASNPFTFKNAGQDAPVETVGWEKCQAFLKNLSQIEGLPEGTYRLLTESEWEYACRAGTTTAFYFGDDESDLDEYGWYSDNGDHETHPVGEKKANSWGLHDMHGNVWEWCHERYGRYPSGGVTDPLGAASGAYRVGRGGGWYFVAELCRSAYRNRYTPGARHSTLGLRLARTMPSYP